MEAQMEPLQEPFPRLQMKKQHPTNLLFAASITYAALKI